MRIFRYIILIAISVPAALSAQISGLAGWDICLDPGHSQRENMGIYGYAEAERNVRVGLRLREMLLNETDIDTVYITRTNDSQSVALYDRSVYANGVGATWFHSIHSDATTMGADVNTTLLLWGQYSNGLEKDPNGGHAMSDIMIRNLTDGMRTTTTHGSIGDCSFYGCTSGGPYLSVNRNTVMPSELSESGFHTNPRQNQIFMNADWKRLEARTFFWSILEFRKISRPLVRILTGIVSDYDTHIPINGAEIIVNERSYVTDTYESLFNKYSNDPDLLHNGFYYFEDIEGDSVEVVVNAEGYPSDTMRVTMADSFFTYNDVRMILPDPPYITETTPVDGDTAHSILDDIIFRFSRPMNKASVESTLVITPQIATRYVWSDLDREFIIRADSIDFKTEYTITISGAATDLHGHPFDGNGDGEGGDDYTIQFTTGSDYIPPVLQANYPALNAKNVELNPIVNLLYDEPLDSASVTTDLIKVEKLSDNSIVPGNLAHYVVDGQSVITFFPSEKLAEDEVYITRVLPGLKDLFGNEVTIKKSIPFRTGVADVYVTRIADFEGGVEDWWRPSGSGSTVGYDIGTDRYPSQEVVNLMTGSQISMQLDYIWNMGAEAWLIREYLAGGASQGITFDTTKTLQVYIFGDGSGTQFRFALDEGDFTVHEVSQWITIDWKGWKLVEWQLNDPAQVGSWIGNGVLDASRYRMDSFQITYAPGANTSGTIYFDDLQVVDKFDVTFVKQEYTALPQAYELSQNYPNPFNPTTRIDFAIKEANHTSLIVYDALGRMVSTLVNEALSPGRYEVSFDGKGFSTGIYFYVLRSGNFTMKHKMVLVK